MDCELAREALSAQLDAESLPVSREDLDAHLTGCRACRAWEASARQLRQGAYLISLPPPRRDRTAHLLTAVMAARRRRAAARRRWLIRAALVALGAAQCALTVPVLVLGHDHGAPLQVAHELGSLNLSVAAAFLVAAWRPAHGAGMVLPLGVATLGLAAVAVLDLLRGQATALSEAPSLIVAAGWLLLIQVSRQPAGQPGSPPDSSLPAWPRGHTRPRRLNGAQRRWAKTASRPKTKSGPAIGQTQ